MKIYENHNGSVISLISKDDNMAKVDQSAVNIWLQMNKQNKLNK